MHSTVMSTETEQVMGAGNLTCHRKTKTAGRKILRCRTAPHKASTCEYSLFFITSGGAKISAASRPPAIGLQLFRQDYGNQDRSEQGDSN